MKLEEIKDINVLKTIMKNVMIKCKKTYKKTFLEGEYYFIIQTDTEYVVYDDEYFPYIFKEKEIKEYFICD